MVRKTRNEIIEEIRAFCEENGLILCLREKINPGDHYVACRNIGPQLFICSRVNPHGWIHPVGYGYSYDIEECVKVIVPRGKDL